MATETPPPAGGPPQPTGIDLEPDILAASLEKGRYGRTPAIFMGLLADDPDREKIRIYQDYELRTCIIIRRADVIHRDRVRNANGVEVSLLFVDKDAQVEMLEVTSEEMQADALSRALRAGEGAPSVAPGDMAALPTPTTATPPISAAVCTKLFCTNLTCGCTSRHSTLCSITCTDHPVCPNPWTKNWFCRIG